MTLFYGQDIFALLELDPNERYISLVELCALLGLPADKYLRRSQANHQLSEGLHTLEVEFDDGHIEDQLCLRIDLLPLWLSTVESQHANQQYRVRLELFQRSEEHTSELQSR